MSIISAIFLVVFAIIFLCVALIIWQFQIAFYAIFELFQSIRKYFNNMN